MVHRELGQQLDLYHIEEHSAGMIYWHPKGTKIFNAIQNYMRQVHEDHNYNEVRTPILVSKSLWETSGHWQKFKENMFLVKVEDEATIKEMALKAMSCPNHIELFDHTNRSYRELPMRYFEFGMVHRNESSGSMHGLMRVRNFTQDDCHIICRESQILEETKNYIEMLKKVYLHFGFDKFIVKLSTRPDNHFGSSEMWDKSESALANACDSVGLSYEIQPNEAAFYGPKLEFTLFDNHGRPWQCGTIQLDYLLPSKERFNMKYTNEEGKDEQPVILHHAVLGSIERFIGILLENTEGQLPLWLAPTQIAVVQVSEKSNEYANMIYKQIQNNKLRVILDDSNDTLSSKIALHSSVKIPYIIVVGERDAIANTIAVRKFGDKKPTVMTLTDFLNSLTI